MKPPRNIGRITRFAGLGGPGVARATRRRAWVLLETVIATGLLITGLAVIGAQVQQADKEVRSMRLRLQAMMLAETKLAELDMGLVELDSVDEIQEEQFGPRYPAFAWRLTTEPTALDDMYVLKLEVLYLPTDVLERSDYQEGSFDFDAAETLHTLYAMRTSPQPLNLAEDFGLDDEEVVELNDQLALLGIPGLTADALDPALLARLDFEAFLEVLPVIADAMGLDISSLLGALPRSLLDSLQSSGLLDDAGNLNPRGRGGETQPP